MKLNILFVDDEANIIRGLKRILRTLKDNWNFFFAEGGNEALEIMEQTKINVVVSDMRMPNMNGAELLEIVKEKYPSTIRFILSGQSNEELALKATRSAHKFIAKPIEPEMLKKTIRQSFSLHQQLDNENLRKVINGINRLPTLPYTYLEIEKELSKDVFSLQKITTIINSDVVMAAKILQLVNSAFFGLPQNISNVSQAINLLGADIIKSLIIYVQVFKSYEGSKNIHTMLNDIWSHSLKVANNAKKIIHNLGNKKNDAEAAYISGLLHDIGKIVILSSNSFHKDILKKMKEKNYSYNLAEEEVLGISHAEVGGYLLRLWGLPETVVETVLHHHNSALLNDESIDILTAVYFANTFTNSSKLDDRFNSKNNSDKNISDIRDLCM